MMFRRTPCLVASWQDDALEVRNYARRKGGVLTPADVAVLHALGEWCTWPELRRKMNGARGLRAAVARLRRQGMIETSDEAPAPVERLRSAWHSWGTLAAAYHFDTKDVSYASRKTVRGLTVARLALDPVPPVVKTLRGPRIALDDFPRRGAFPSTLLSRRSWRRFGPEAIRARELAALLGLTWGTQRWFHLDGLRLPLKTSPSGGACHSLEAYVAVSRVKGIAPGLYHYGHDTHTLTRLKAGWDRSWITRSLGGQDWFADAAAVVFMTSVFPRVQWRYRFPRAYRTVLLEAGHFCQTFCLTATWLGLAPFCTAALADSRIERRLGIDGVTESVLYAMGVGTRPRGVAWAPWPGRVNTPVTTLPAHRQRRRVQGGRKKP